MTILWVSQGVKESVATMVPLLVCSLTRCFGQRPSDESISFTAIELGFAERVSRSVILGYPTDDSANEV